MFFFPIDCCAHITQWSIAYALAPSTTTVFANGPWSPLESSYHSCRGWVICAANQSVSWLLEFLGEVDDLESLPAFEEQMWQRAGDIRQEWLRPWVGATSTLS